MWGRGGMEWGGGRRERVGMRFGHKRGMKRGRETEKDAYTKNFYRTMKSSSRASGMGVDTLNNIDSVLYLAHKLNWLTNISTLDSCSSKLSPTKWSANLPMTCSMEEVQDLQDGGGPGSAGWRRSRICRMEEAQDLQDGGGQDLQDGGGPGSAGWRRPRICSMKEARICRMEEVQDLQDGGGPGSAA